MKTIAVIRKPLDGTVASNVMKHSCGGLNIDATRIMGEPSSDQSMSAGRFPCNLILNDIAAKALDEQTGDVGGASRYFKNVKEDLVSYLRGLITPPEGGVVDVVALDIIDPTGEDESVHGFIVMGTPSKEQADELLRICKPGAHVFLIAPEEQPTGHTGMCRMEDVGFEIRDTILLLLEADGFWYIAKPSKAEREAGCADLRKGKARGNNHPTVKPYAIMEALMKSVPKGLPAVDPFMGSGSTGIAALHTGHDFIGIEREEEYMKIADARIRHWDQAAWRGHSVEIQSDVEKDTEADEDISLSDLFGSGG